MLANFFGRKSLTPVEVVDNELKRLHGELRSSVTTFAQYQLVLKEIAKLNSQILGNRSPEVSNELTQE